MQTQKPLLKLFSYLLMGIALVTSLNLAVKRHLYEESKSTIEIAVPYSDLQRLAIKSGTPLKKILKRLKEDGSVTSIALHEQTISDFINNGKLTLLKGSEVMNMYRVGHVNRYLLTHLYKQVKVQADRFYLIIEEKEDYERIKNFLNAEYGNDNVKQIGRWNILEVVDEREDLLEIGVGISNRHIETIESLGFNPIIRLRNSKRINPDVIKQTFLSFTNLIPQTTLIFEGKSTLGYPRLIPFVQDKILDHNLKVGLVEFTHQLGLKQLIELTAPHTNIVHTIPSREQASLGPTKSTKRYVRAVKERGVTILMLHPFLQVFQETPLLEYNLTYFNSIYQGVVDLDVSIGSTALNPKEPFSGAKSWELLLIGLGVIGTLLCLFSFIRELRIRSVSALIVLYCAVFYLSESWDFRPDLINFLTLITAILIPVFAMVSLFPSEETLNKTKNRYFSVIIYLVSLLGICLIGASFIIGLLSSPTYLVGIHRFMGVKLSFILPLILIAIYFYLEPHRISASMYVFKRIVQSPMRTASFMAIAISFIFVVLMVLRSGNYVMMPKFPFEEQFRTLLEDLLFIRPRTKEILIGYPSLMLGYIFLERGVSRQWIWFCNMIGAIALVSVVNSFCHIHTPLLVSLHRTSLGLGLGLVTGIIVVASYKILLNTIQRLTSK